jgi:uncharacterized membrane protein
MKFVAEFVASLCTALFAGASLYINLVEHPARMECGTALAATEFGPSYRRATVMQASLAVIGLVAAMWAWWLHAGLEWLVGGILLGAVVPFTLVVIFPTNRKLLDPSLDRNSEVARRLLKKWGTLHAVRTTLSLAALLIVLAAMAAATKRDDLRAKEVELRQDLSTLRDVISQYTLDKQKAPQSLDDLKTAGYIHDIPKDPFTGEANWEPHQEKSLMAVDQQEPGIDDVHSASNLISSDGSAYSSW